MNRSWHAGKIIALVFMLAAAWLLYAPGLAGGYILDDVPNLQTLEQVKAANDNSAGIADYMISGLSSPSGRPVSLLSFALQADAWPSDARAFKRLNLIIHLALGIAIFLFVGKLLSLRRLPERESAWLALAITAFWLFHPLNASTVLYIVQRMTQLSALFTVLALISYLHGRSRVVGGGDIRSALAWMTLGVGGFGLLAVFSKETGALIPLFILVIEYTLGQGGQARPRPLRRWLLVFAWLPAAALPLLVAWQLGFDFTYGFGIRDFSLLERVLTQPRVLLDYLLKIFLPLPGTLGVYQDDFAISRGLLDPATTLPALLACVGLVVSGIALRRRTPLLAFGFLWFFAGHVMESTVLSLEIYFEHRNYLPMLGPLLVLVVGFRQLLVRVSGQAKPALLAAPLGLLFLFHSAILAQEARIWGDPVKQALTWAAEHPGSFRAQARPIIVLLGAGHPEPAAKMIPAVLVEFPQRFYPYMLWASASCQSELVPMPPWEQMLTDARERELDFGTLDSLDRFATQVEQGACPRWTTARLRRLIESLRSNEHETNERFLDILTARSYAAEARWKEALDAARDALEAGRAVETHLMAARLAAAAGLPEEAERQIRLARELANSEVSGNSLHAKAIAGTEEIVRKVLAQQDNNERTGSKQR